MDIWPGRLNCTKTLESQCLATLGIKIENWVEALLQYYKVNLEMSQKIILNEYNLIKQKAHDMKNYNTMYTIATRNTYMHAYTYMYIHVHMQIHTCIIHVHTCTHAYTCTYLSQPKTC